MFTPEVKDLINQVLVVLLSGVILPTIPLAYKLGKAWVEAKIASIKNQNARDLVEFAFTRLDHIVNNVVAEISQTAQTNTALSDIEKKARRAAAFKRVKNQLVETDETALKSAVKDFDRYLVTKIEAARYNQKLKECTVPPKN